jgi:hypothetical protein
MEESELAEPYTAESLEGYFQHSKDSGGDYSIAGKGDLYKARWKVSDETRQFVIKTPADAKDVKEWSSRGLSCYPDKMPFWDLGMHYLVIECTEPDFFPAMNRIAATILEDGLVSAPDVIKLFQEQRIFWSNTPVTMTNEQAAGLFGELFFMLEYFPTHLSDLINDCWGGSNHSDKDFSWDDLQVEVKTAMSPKEPIAHVVSNVHQLQEDGRPLVMFSLVAHPDEGGGRSLHALVDSVLSALSEDSSAWISFTDTLKDLGYILHHPDMEKFKFTLTHGDGQFYAVTDHFPRLTTEDNPDDTRINIGSYQISLANIENLRMTLSKPTTVEGILTDYMNLLKA